MRAEAVDGELALESVRRYVFDRPELAIARVVDQAVDAAGFVADASDDTLDVRGFGQVKCREFGTAIGQILEAVPVAVARSCVDVPAVGQQRAGRFVADTGRAAGDECSRGHVMP